MSRKKPDPPIPPMPEPEHVCDDGCLVRQLAEILEEVVAPILDDEAKVTVIVRWPNDQRRFVVVGNDEARAMEKMATAAKLAVKPAGRAESWN